MQNIHYAAAVAVLHEEIVNIKSRLAKEFARTLIFKRQQTALNDANTLHGNIAIPCIVFITILGNICQDRTQVLEIDQAQAFILGNLESNCEVAFLGLSQAKHNRKDFWANLLDICAYLVAMCAVQIPEAHRIALWLKTIELEVINAICDVLVHLARLRGAS